MFKSVSFRQWLATTGKEGSISDRGNEAITIFTLEEIIALEINNKAVTFKQIA